MDPQLNPANKYPLSDIDNAEGAPSPCFSNLAGALATLLLYLNRLSAEEK